MNLFFAFTNKYLVEDSPERIINTVISFIEESSYHPSRNISGSVADDNTFKLWPKWSFGYVSGLTGPQSLTFLTGTIRKIDGKTTIETISRPNYLLVAFFYFLLFLIIAKLLGFNTMLEGTKAETLLALPVLIALAGVMRFGTVRLRNRFEKLMQIRRQE